MAAVAAEARVFLEVRRRLQSALLILGDSKEGGLPMAVSVTPSSLRMQSPGGCTELRLPAGVRLAPSTCRGLQHVPGDGLHLRLHARAESRPELISVFNQSSQDQECCTFYCQSCGEVIIRDRMLLRVLPLPGDNWGALVDEWCCHPDPFANKPLHPRENDCFTGDCFYLVNLKSDLWQPRPEGAPVETHHLSSENHLKLKPKANTKVICKRCKVMLGETVSSETTKFYMTEIIILPSERNFPIIPRSQFVQSVLAQCVVELSSARSTFRFTIQGHDDKVYILLWLLNSDSLVIESLGQYTNIKKFPVLEDVLKPDSSSAWNAVKVLYQPCIKSRNAELSSLWENDLSVHSLTLPSTTCLELLLILSKSNATLPPSLRCMNSFQVAAAAAKSLQSCPTLCDPHRRQPTRLCRPWDSPGGLFEDVAKGVDTFLSSARVHRQPAVSPVGSSYRDKNSATEREQGIAVLSLLARICSLREELTLNL